MERALKILDVNSKAGDDDALLAFVNSGTSMKDAVLLENNVEVLSLADRESVRLA